MVARVVGFAMLVLFLLDACSIPRRTLSVDEKKADLYWVFSKFGESYAPLTYKESLFHFNYNDLKQQYLDMITPDQTNDQFYHSVHEFVSTFRDAHTHASFSAAGRPGRTKVAYLGFIGSRKAEDVVVRFFLPTSANVSANYPIKVGDIITSFDGQSPRDYVMSNLGPRRNLGQDESTFTALASNITFRMAYDFDFPTKEFMDLTVKRGDKEVQVQVPWVIQDYADFINQMRSADPYFQNLANLAQGNYSKLPKKAQAMVQSFAKGQDFFKNRRFESFVHFDMSNPFTSKTLKAILEDDMAVPCENLSDSRKVPELSYQVPGSCVYPSYLARINDEGKLDWRGSKMVGYIFIPSFSNPEETAGEFRNTLRFLQDHNVESLVIDTIDNGGGSLSLGIEMAQALSASTLALPTIRFRTNDAWIDEFQDMSISPFVSDIERQLYKNVYHKLLEDKESSQPLSREFDMSALFPYSFAANATTKPMKITLLVNEMCASMCDIFAGILQDNGLATVMGSKTMGAGGNVNMHMTAPNSNMILTQTGSLIVRTNGEYIENVGVSPDVAMEVSASVDEKYDAVIEAAFKSFAAQQ